MPDGGKALAIGQVAPVIIPWLVEEVVMMGEVYYSLSGLPVWVPCFSLQDWQVVPMQWASPLEHLRANGGKNYQTFPQILGRKVGDVSSLLVHAARSRFWNLPVVAIRQLAKSELGVETKSNDIGDIFAAIKGALNCDDEAAVQCLEQRCVEMAVAELTEVDHIVLTDEATDAIDNHDKTEAEPHKNHIKTCEANIEELTRVIKARVADIKAGSAQKRRKKKPTAKIPANGAAFTQEEANNLLPPHSRLYKDYFNNRWLLWYRSPGNRIPGPWRTKSKSWGDIGHRAAILFLLRAAWGEAKLHGEICHMQGL